MMSSFFFIYRIFQIIITINGLYYLINTTRLLLILVCQFITIANESDNFITFNNLKVIIIMQKYFTPQLKRYHTSEGVPNSHKRQRNKTVYLCDSVPKIEDQYAELAVQSVKKHYHVSNLKPFAVNKSIFTQLKKEVQNIQPVNPQPNVQNFFSKDENVEGKIRHLVVSALKTESSKRRTRKNFLKKQLLIQSEVWDDHQLLMEDYRQDAKAERASRKKTIQNLNEKIIKKYPSLVQSEGRNNKDRLIKFKKETKVTKKYMGNQETRPAQKNYQNILDLCKDDYGIYSRSANRALYYEDLNRHGFGQNNKSIKQERVKNSLQQLKMQKTFYRSYMGSYSQRKNILRDSQASLNH